MSKFSSIVLRICEWIAKYSLYTLIFLMPVFFLPWTTDVLDFNKQTLLIFLSFVALFAWMLKTLISGKFEIKISKINCAVGAMFAIYLLATVFSVNRYGSFWGWPQITAESLLTLIGLVIFYFLASSIFHAKEIFIGTIVLSFSVLVAEILGILQLFGFTFSLNTTGSPGSLGFFAAIFLPLAIAMLILAKKWWKILFALIIISSALVLFLVNYSILWWAVAIGSALIISAAIIKKNIFDGRWMSLPTFFLAVALFFAISGYSMPFIPQKANEAFLPQNDSLAISMQAIKQMPVFGSGPGTFSYDFLKFKDSSFSQSSLWNAIFSQAASKVLTDFASTGVLGIVALLLLLGFPVFYGIKFLIFKKTLPENEPDQEMQKRHWILAFGFFAAFFVQVVAYFLYSSNLTLNFLNFFLMAGLVVLTAGEKKEFELKPSSMLTLGVTFVFTLLFIFGIGLLFLDGQRYVAEVDYFKGATSFQAGNSSDGVKNLETAVKLNPSSDFYFVQLSRVYLFNLQNELKNATANSTDEKNKVQNLIANSVNAAKYATTLNPSSSGNWANSGYIYQSLYGIVGDSSTWALKSYDQALKLDPNNPYLLSQEGTVNFISSQSVGPNQASQKNQLLSSAKTQLEQAVKLNSNYSNGLYALGLVYDALGDKAGAIKEFTAVQKLNPKDATVLKILSNLNAGLPALQAPPTATPPSITPAKSK